MPFLEAHSLSKNYGTIAANLGVDFFAERGKICALLGENGAGKTTLARILAGEIKADSGTIILNGKRVYIDSPHKAALEGIGLVHQHPLLVPDLSIAENLCLGAEPLMGGLILDKKRMLMRAVNAARDFGFSLNPQAIVGDLSHAEKQEAEILRVLSRGAELLILDEPTSLLSTAEADALFLLLRRLADAGKAVVVVTHRLAELRQGIDSFFFMRDGRSVGQLEVFDEERAYNLMFGESGQCDLSSQSAQSPIPSHKDSQGLPALEVKDIRLPQTSANANAAGAKALNFIVQRGECLAIVALAGNGLEDLEFALSGLRPISGSCLRVAGSPVSGIEKTRSAGMAYIPSDRLGLGICPQASIRENLLALDGLTAFNFPGSSKSSMDAKAKSRCTIFPPPQNMERLAGSLSGGQIQALIINRELSLEASWVLACQPTSGLDARSREIVYTALLEAKRKGRSIILLSSDIDEALALADRIAVLYRGSFTLEAENRPGQTDKVSRAMLGET